MIYIVSSGDTVASIAARFSTSVADIARDNALAFPYAIVPGQALLIDESDAAPEIFADGFAYPFIDRAILSATLPYLGRLAIFSYGFRPDGSLVVIDDAPLLAAARDAGVPAMLVLTSIGDDGKFSTDAVSAILRDDAARANLVRNVTETARSLGYAAVNSDIEYIAAADRERYVAFIGALAASLHAVGLTLDVSLAPKTSDDQPGLLYEGMDYAALGQLADTLLLMTYEWGYKYSEPRAVAPINLVRRVVDYAVSVIPREKLHLGVPNYGYDWQLPWREGVPAVTIGNVEAAAIAADRGAVIEYDALAETPYFRYIAEDGTSHEVWFEDARSIAAKLSLVREYSLGGIGVWQIMRWFPGLWLQL
ncbi:MAG: LysM peptidoglycan-binding domain-containing protein [Ruminococcaceae bacterium]|nr:LysM peptidoglycan-binding domain-containing protein [Oscillospiraceae bacterium]